MSERGDQLLETADRQIGELIGFFSQGSEAGLSRPCASRDKLGDGTVGALASHTADSYLRIAAFLRATNQTSPARSGPHRARSHMPPGHGESDRYGGVHGRDYIAENVDLPGLLKRLAAGRAGVQPRGRPDRPAGRRCPIRRQLQVLRWSENPGAGHSQFAQAPRASD